MLSATVPALAGLLVEKASPRAWEALSDRPWSAAGAAHVAWWLSAVDRGIPLV